SARQDRARWERTIADMRLYIQGSNLAKDLTDDEAKVLLDYLTTNMSRSRGGQGLAKPDPNSRLPRTLMKGDQMKYRVVEFLLPKPEVEPHEIAVDAQGNGWITQRTGGKLGRLDVKTLEYKEFDPPPAASKTVRLNGIVSAPGGGQLWFVENAMNQMGRIDPVTGKIDEFEVPVKNAVPRKTGMDSQGNVWVGLHGAGKLMKIDYKTLKMTVYSPPTEDAGVYSVQGDPK